MVVSDKVVPYAKITKALIRSMPKSNGRNDPAADLAGQPPPLLVLNQRPDEAIFHLPINPPKTIKSQLLRRALLLPPCIWPCTSL
jgi:hypothetical protein